MIPYGRQSIDADDVAQVVRVLQSDFLTQGPAVPAFEAAVREACNAGHAAAMNSATSALHVACMALDVGPGDRVWTSPITFVASANCARYCGAEVDFVDIDPATYNVSIDALKDKLQLARASNQLPKVVIAVDFAGQPCDLAALRVLADEYGFRLIEDASHAVGATYRGEPVGSGRYSDITIFSFHPVKIITTGEGGMALTNDAELGGRMARLRSHGITREAAEMTEAPHGGWYYQQLELGYNYRLTDLQAALGLSQMRRIGRFLARRRELAARYNVLLKGLPVTCPFQAAGTESAWHLYVVRLHPECAGPRHRTVFERLRAGGIGVNLHYIPVYLQPYYRQLGFRPGYCPEAERYYATAISLPLYPDLSDAQQEHVVQVLREALAYG